MPPSSSSHHHLLLRVLRVATLACAALAAACSDRGPALPDTQAPPPEGSLARLECRAIVARGEVRCSDASTSGVRGNLMLGGQGERVRIASSGTHYDGDSIFQSQVTVQNLLDQEMGTPDGTDVYGVNVFFVSGPVAVDGTGTVEVANADGVGAFTAAGQPYFHYHEILAPRGVSLPALWQFRVPPTVNEFTFGLLVETRLAAEDGVLRWSRVQGSAAGTHTLYDVWGSSPQNVWAVGGAVGRPGAVLHWQGSAWSWVANPAGVYLNAVWGTDARSVVAVGPQGTIIRYDGNRWRLVGSGSGTLHDVWAASPESWFAVGLRDGSAVIMHSTDGGSSWTAQLGTSTFEARAAPRAARPARGIPGPRRDLDSPAPSDLHAVWGASPEEVFAVGERKVDPGGDGWSCDDVACDPIDAVILHTVDGGEHWAATEFADSVASELYGIWGSSIEDVYAVGVRTNPGTHGAEGIRLHSADGGASWTVSPVSAPAAYATSPTAVWGRSADDVYILGSQYTGGSGAVGLVLRSTNRGITWNPVPDAAPTTAFSAWAVPGGDLFLAQGTIRRYDGAAWSDTDVPAGTTSWRGAWSPAPDDLVVVGIGIGRSGHDVALTARSVDGGATWASSSIEGVPEGELYAVAATSDSTLFAAGAKVGAALLARSTDGGATWTELGLANTGAARALWVAPDGVVHGVGTEYDQGTGLRRGFIFRSADGGDSWSLSLSTAPAGERLLLGVGGCSSQELYAVGLQRASPTAVGRGLILRSVDGGLTWGETLIDAALSTTLSGVVCAASGRYAVGERVDSTTHQRWGVILRSPDGLGWELDHAAAVPAENPEGIGYTAIWAGENGDLYAAGLSGILLHRSAAGWTTLSSGTGARLYGIAGSSARAAWAVGADGTILRGVR